MLDAFPSSGRELGLRAYEGRVDDLSPAGLRRRAAERRRHLAELEVLDAGDGDPSRPQPAATTARSSSRGMRIRLIHPPLGRRMRGSW